MMDKSQISNLPDYFDKYIDCVPDVSLRDALSIYGAAILEVEVNMMEKVGQLVYAPEKWTIKDVLQHIIDTERIFAYRALRIARQDQTPLAGFDENLFVKNAHASDRKISALISEFNTVRQSTELLYQSFNKNDLLREALMVKTNISVLALGYTIVGHGIHHVNIIKERYYPLIKS